MAPGAFHATEGICGMTVRGPGSLSPLFALAFKPFELQDLTSPQKIARSFLRAFYYQRR
jgi:hypothetical protein